MDRIEQILWNKTVDQLTRLCKAGKLKGTSGYKDTKVARLYELYSKENWAKQIYDELTECEQEMMKCYIQNKYHPQDYQIEEIMKKYQYSGKSYFSHNEAPYFSEESKANLFFIEYEEIPEEFKAQLDKLVEPLKMKIEPCKEVIDPEEYYANIIGREDRIHDIDEFIKFINISKIKPTKAKEQMPKSAIIKLYQKLKYPEILRNEEIEIENIRSIEDTTITYGIMKLLRNSLIVRIEKGEFYIDNLFCEDYAKQNKVEKVKYLLENYTREGIGIDECSRIQSGKFHIQNPIPEYGKARKIIIEHLKQCPVNEWIDVDELKKWIRINNYYFLRKYTGEVLKKHEYFNEYFEASHEDFENAFIDIVLMEYLATLGIVDVIIGTATDEYGYEEYMEVDYFRVTKLGSYVLGINKEEYVQENQEDELTVTKDFDIIIGETAQKLNHELYFDRFLSKKSDNPLIYKLDFKGMAKALSLGISIEEIYVYLTDNCTNGIPENVESQILEWIEDAKKIKIKTVTILEMDKDNFAEIMENSNMKKYIDSVRKDVIVLKNSKIENVRKELEKQEKFCIDG